MHSPQHVAIWDRFPSRTPILSGEVTTLRPYLLSDVSVIEKASRCADIPHVDTSIAQGGEKVLVQYVTANAARPSLKQGWSWTITDRETGEAAGHIGVWAGNVVHGRAVIGYWVLPKFRRRGYAREALKLVTDFVKELPGVTRIELHIEIGNEASWRIAEQCAYQREAVLARWQIIDGTPRDMYMYTVLTDLS